MSQVRVSSKNQSPISQPSTPPESVTLLRSAADDFMLDREARRCTRATLYWYRRYVEAAVAWLIDRGVTEPGQVTAGHMRTYLLSLQDRNLADYTLHHHASAARAFFNFCAEEGLIPVSPMLRVKMPRLPKELLPAFTPDEVRSLLKACDNPRDTAIILCLLDTGCRASEFIGLTIGSVDNATGAVTVRQGKGKKDRVTYLGAKARRALRKYLVTRPGVKPTEPLWLCEHSTRALSLKGFQTALQRIGERAGVAHCHAHTFRRSFALWSLRAGMDIFSLQRIMGHSSLVVLRKYLDQAQEDLEAAHRQHGAVDTML